MIMVRYFVVSIQTIKAVSDWLLYMRALRACAVANCDMKPNISGHIECAGGKGRRDQYTITIKWKFTGAIVPSLPETRKFHYWLIKMVDKSYIT